MLMACYGADVLKVEGTTVADMGRSWGPPFQGDQASFFLGLNSGKRAVAIDLKRPEGVALCRRLAACADVLVENFRPGAMNRLGLGYDALRSLNPKLIYCSISGYGQDGPWRDEAAFDLILQAASGLISITGTPAGGLARCGHSVADITAGMFALIGILMALWGRQATGEGQLVDVSMFDGMISAMASNFAYYFGSGVVPRPMGTAFATIVPYAAFPTADREIVIAAANEKLWAAFCQAIERPELATDPRYASNALRVQNREQLESLIIRLLREKPSAYWLERLRAQGIPCALVQTLEDVAASPQAQARGMFPILEHPTAGPVRVTGPPVKFSRTPGAVQRPAPLVGEHSIEALGDWLGLSSEEIAGLLKAQVVRQA